MYVFGEIILISFPYSDATGTKKRPALVLVDFNDGDILVARVSSQTTGSDFDVELSDWKASGLIIPSYARLHKIATLNKSLIAMSLGSLSEQDSERVKLAFSDLAKIIVKTS